MSGRPISQASTAVSFALVGALLAPVQAGAQNCEHGRISHVFVDNHSIFDVETLPEDPRVRWAYELANRVHVRTREGFIVRELLLEEGECYNPEYARESARVLRDFRFIADADVFGVPQPDGTRHLVVDTRDEWTTKLSVAMSLDDGIQLEGGAITEENFLGLGALVSASFRDRDATREAGGRLEVPRIGRRPWDARLGLTRTRVGTGFEQLLIRPIVAEEPQWLFRQKVAREEELFSYHIPEGRGYSHLVLPSRAQHAEVTTGFRVGRPGNLFLLGGGVSWEAFRFGGEVGVPEVVPDGDFSRRVPAGEDALSELSGQLQDRETSRINILLGTRHLRFQEWRGLDAIRGVQDVPFGLETLLTAGRSVNFFSRSDAPERADLQLRAEAFWGGAVGTVLFHGLLAGEGRRALGAADGRKPWRDLIAEGVGLAYWKPGPESRHLLVARASGAGGWRHSGPFQISLGGQDGVRGFPEGRHPGARRLILSLEDRIALDSPLPDLADLGLTLMADGGYMRAGSVPFGSHSGFQASVGAGLRLGFPAGTSSVIRFDVMTPLTGPDRFRSPIVRVSAREILGLLAPLGSGEVDQARRSGLGLDFTSVVTDPYRW